MLDKQRIIYPKGPVGPQRICFERFPPTEDANLGQDTPTERRERKKWPPADDMVLINCWLNTSRVAVDGTEQKSFWKRIEANYAASHQAAGAEKREPSHCKQRWSKINDLVCKFCVAYEAAKSEKGSGENESDVLTLAHEIFYNEHKRKFTLDHAWNKLRNDPKWCEVSMGKTDGSNKKRRCGEDGAQSSSSQVSNVDGQATMRPPGVKAAKDKGKKSLEEGKKSSEGGKVLSEFQSMWTIKEKDLAMKERLAKISLLDTLLAKVQLSEIEEALKNKLISDILSN